jgi:AraC-like DNA-binding protein
MSAPELPLGPADEARLLVMRQARAGAPLADELSRLLAGWVARRCPQRTLEKGLDQVVSVLGVGDTNCPSAADVRLALHQGLVAAAEGEDVVSSLCAILDARLLRRAERLDGPGIADAVETQLRQAIGQSVGMEEISRRLGFDLSYMTRVFKRSRGESPLRHLIRLRIDEAKRLLRQSPELDVGAISELVGYPDHRYFARLFKKVTGMRPSEYRARALSVERS